MDWLNYHHLRYFWIVAREGSIAKAVEEADVAQPTISKQIRQLESSLGDKLFKKSGRNLVLTEFGQGVFRYAEEIFSVGRELQNAVAGTPGVRPVKFEVGLPDVLPKSVCHRLLKPALSIADELQIVCHEGGHDDLVGELALHRLDLVLSNAPASPIAHIRAFNHLLGECGVSFFATAPLARKHRRRFPRSLDGAPMLLPTRKTAVRRDLDQWFYASDIRPKVVGEFQDRALMKVFGQDGIGLFPGPSIVEKEICQQHAVRVVGRIEDITEKYYAISVERRLRHPAIVAICEAAREMLFR
ncbi:MAG: transcriptional activator NhaR [Planctomycetaceae bacterium]|nr:transcriptional activator NhaR [Planctomycetaceae bacterium]